MEQCRAIRNLFGAVAIVLAVPAAPVLALDCNGNGIEDACDLDCGPPAGACDVAGCGQSGDCNANSVPDTCETTAQGLAGTYYDNDNFTGAVHGRIDETIDFEWDTGAPWPDMGGDFFTIRWAGYLLTPAVDGTYTFHTHTDDGVRLWVNHTLVVDNWSAHGHASGTIALAADEVYPIVVEYREAAGSARAHLYWQPPGQAEVIIPAAHLIPAQDCNGNEVPDACDLAGSFRGLGFLPGGNYSYANAVSADGSENSSNGA